MDPTKEDSTPEQDDETPIVIVPDEVDLKTLSTGEQTPAPRQAQPGSAKTAGGAPPRPGGAQPRPGAAPAGKPAAGAQARPPAGAPARPADAAPGKPAAGAPARPAAAAAAKTPAGAPGKAVAGAPVKGAPGAPGKAAVGAHAPGAPPKAPAGAPAKASTMVVKRRASAAADRSQRPVPSGPRGPAREPIDEGALQETENALDREIVDELAKTKRAAWDTVAVPWFFKAFGYVVVGLLIVLWYIGRRYYGLAAHMRPFHHLHEFLKPTGTIGLAMGTASTALILLSLTYLARKNFFSMLRRRGSMQGWLGFHIVTGLLAAATVGYHAAFAPSSALGILSLGAMLVVLLSGLLGRYIYIHIPRTLEGRELELDAVRRRLVLYKRKLAELGVTGALLEGEGAGKTHSWLPPTLVRLVHGDQEGRVEFESLRQKVFSKLQSHAQADRILLLVERLCRERQWVVRYQEFRNLIGTWRFLHRWLAVVLVVAVLFHIAMGIRFGHLWVFFGRR